MRSIEQAVVGDHQTRTAAQRSLDLSQRRQSPKFFIVDRRFVPVFCSSDLSDSPLLTASLNVLDRMKTAGPLTGTTLEPLDADHMLRIVPVAGERDDCYAVFIETVNSRRSLRSVVERYDITKREADVLALLVSGCSTTTIAERLAITEGTVGDHVKSLFRKTATNRRSELVARVLHYDNDTPRAPRTGVPTQRGTIAPGHSRRF